MGINFSKLNKKVKRNPVDLQELSRVLRVKEIYQELYGVYIKDPTFILKNKITSGTAIYSCLLKISLLAEICEVSEYDFLKAQFKYYHQWFSKAPTIQQCCSIKTNKNSMYRARLYQQELKKGIAQPQLNVVNTICKVVVDDNKHKEILDKRVEKLMSLYNIEESEALALLRTLA